MDGSNSVTVDAEYSLLKEIIQHYDLEKANSMDGVNVENHNRNVSNTTALNPNEWRNFLQKNGPEEEEFIIDDLIKENEATTPFKENRNVSKHGINEIESGVKIPFQNEDKICVDASKNYPHLTVENTRKDKKMKKPRSTRVKAHKFLVEEPVERAEEPVERAIQKSLFGLWITIKSLGPLILWLFDIGTDISLCIVYFNANHMKYFTLTLTFIVLPNITTNALSYYWSVHDAEKHENVRISPQMKTFRMICHICFLGLAYRPIESLWYGHKHDKFKGDRKRTVNSKKAYILHEFVATIKSTTCLMHILEAFTESAPQLILQYYIFRKGETDIADFIVDGSKEFTETLQFLCLVTSLLSVSWSVTNYHRSFRQVQKKQSQKWWIAASSFVTRTYALAARLVMLTLFTRYYTSWCLLPLFCRWFVMVLSLLSIGPPMTNMCYQHGGLELVFGLVYVFVYVNFKSMQDDSNTSDVKLVKANRRAAELRKALYYFYDCVESTILLGLSSQALTEHPEDFYFVTGYVILTWYFCCSFVGCKFKQGST